MVIFHSYVSLPEGILKWLQWLTLTHQYPSMPMGVRTWHVQLPLLHWAKRSRGQDHGGNEGDMMWMMYVNIYIYIYMCIYIYITTIIVIYVYIYIYYNYRNIYGPPRRPATPLPMLSPPAPTSNHPHGGGQPSTTIRQDLICYTCLLASCHLCTT